MSDEFAALERAKEEYRFFLERAREELRKTIADITDTQCLLEYGIERQYPENWAELSHSPCVPRSWTTVRTTCYGQRIWNVADFPDTSNLLYKATCAAGVDPMFRARRSRAKWEPWQLEEVVADTGFCKKERIIKLRWNRRERQYLYLMVFYPKGGEKHA